MLAATLCLLNARGWHHRCVSPVMQEGSADADKKADEALQSDVIIRRWMSLFNLDRTQMTMDTDDHLQEKKREHRPSRKQAIKFDEIADTGAGANQMDMMASMMMRAAMSSAPPRL